MKRAKLSPILASALLAAPAFAQQPAATPTGLDVELNAVAATDTGCMMTFVVESGLAEDIAKAAYQMVFFNAEGMVERMTVLDFQDVPAGKTRVRQFNVGGTDCTALSRVLINDVATCEGSAVAEDACIAGLTASSRTDIDLSN